MDTRDYKNLFEESSSIIMQSPFAFSIMKGEELVITFANNRMKDFWGKGNDVEGKTLLQVLPELKDQPFPGMIANVFHTGIPVYANEILARLQHNDKMEDRYFNLIYQPFREADGSISGVSTIAYEVTELVLSRKKAEENEQRFRNMIYSSPSLIAILEGEEMILTVANDSILEQLGKGREIIGKPYFEANPELKQQGLDAIFREVLATGVPCQTLETPVFLIRNGQKELSYYNYLVQPQRKINGEIEGLAIIATEITPQALSNKKVKESEERFRLLVMQAPLAICVLRGQDYMIETINERMVEMWDRKMEDVLYKPAFDVLTELKDQGFKELLDNVVRTGERFIAEELPISLQRNGQLENAFIKFVYEPLRETDGTITGVMALAHEITGQVVARKRMEAQAKMHEDMLMTAPGYVCTLRGPNHVYELVNEKYQQLFGKRKIKGKPILEALPELQGQGFDLLLDKVYTTGETYVGFDIPIKLARDENLAPELLYFNFSYQPMYDENKIIYSILVFGYEVTELVIAKHKIEESEKKFRLLTNAMPQKITNADAEGNVFFFNQQWTEETGYSLEELKGWGWEKAMHPDDLAHMKSSWISAVNSGSVFEVECRILHKDGGYHWNLNRAVPVRDENGKITMWVGTNTDINEQKEQKNVLEKAVKVRTQQLEEANRELILQNDETVKRSAELLIVNKELEAFTYICSHDLQEPLRKIQILSDRILQKENHNLSVAGKQYFEHMQNAANRMQILIEDLLDFSRLSTTDIQFEKTDFTQIIEQIKTELKETIEEKKAVIDVADMCDLKVIRFQFRQLFQNLISNSLKFSRPGIAPHIIIKSSMVPSADLQMGIVIPEKEYCHIMVSDNGIGFKPEYNEKIFELFQQLHNKDTYKGTGIGLAIIKKIVNNHKGFISAEGKLGEGATFHIYIPIL